MRTDRTSRHGARGSNHSTKLAVRRSERSNEIEGAPEAAMNDSAIRPMPTTDHNPDRERPDRVDAAERGAGSVSFDRFVRA